MWSDDVLRWRGDGIEGVISHDADAAYIYRRVDGSGVSFILLLLKIKGQCQYKWNMEVPPSTGTAFLSAVFAIDPMQAWTLV